MHGAESKDNVIDYRLAQDSVAVYAQCICSDTTKWSVSVPNPIYLNELHWPQLSRLYFLQKYQVLGETDTIYIPGLFYSSKSGKWVRQLAATDNLYNHIPIIVYIKA